MKLNSIKNCLLSFNNFPKTLLGKSWSFSWTKENEATPRRAKLQSPRERWFKVLFLCACVDKWLNGNRSDALLKIPAPGMKYDILHLTLNMYSHFFFFFTIWFIWSFHLVKEYFVSCKVTWILPVSAAESFLYKLNTHCFAKYYISAFQEEQLIFDFYITIIDSNLWWGTRLMRKVKVKVTHVCLTLCNPMD